MNYSKVKKEVERFAIQPELIVPPGSVVKFNDRTDLSLDSFPLAQSDKNFNIAFAMGEKMLTDWKYGACIRPF